MQQYGRFECRCTLPKGKNLWSAFWMYGDGWPPEIDVLETSGLGVQEINLHWGHPEDGTKDSLGAQKIRIEKDSETNFHEFAVEWTPEKIDFITDGIKVFTYRDTGVLDKYFNTPMGMLINHGIKNLDVEESTFHVDYVRAYK